ncbi:MAG: response regulator transcription factor [Planctomycetes bacterium]|nr:response regulator transcription factor [Planctomycetota bacterium]
MTKILLIEDDASMAEGLVFNLSRAGYEVVHAARGDEAASAARAAAPDLAILDLMLPGKSGFQILEQWSREKVTFPVLILSAKSGELDKVRGFDLGAADYVTKPFSVAELLARVRARLAPRTAAGASATIRFETGTVYIAKLAFESKTGSVPLTPTEIEILKCLRARNGQAVARDELLQAIWGCGPNSTRTLDAHVARLRKKIEVDAASPRHLLTVHRVGYRLASAD